MRRLWIPTLHALAFDAEGRALWLGAITGLFKSEDGGLTWTRIELPVTGHAPDVMAIAAHPHDVRTLYVGTHEAGVVRSADGGRTWTAVNAGLGGLDVHGLAIDPSTPEKPSRPAWAGSSSTRAPARGSSATRDGVFRSEDAGQSWRRAAGPKNVAAVAVNPKRPSEVYAATVDGTTWASTDGGQRWEPRR